MTNWWRGEALGPIIRYDLWISDFLICMNPLRAFFPSRTSRLISSFVRCEPSSCPVCNLLISVNSAGAGETPTKISQKLVPNLWASRTTTFHLLWRKMSLLWFFFLEWGGEDIDADTVYIYGNIPNKAKCCLDLAPVLLSVMIRIQLGVHFLETSRCFLPHAGCCWLFPAPPPGSAPRVCFAIHFKRISRLEVAFTRESELPGLPIHSSVVSSDDCNYTNVWELMR